MKIKILQLINSLKLGGAERFLVNLCNHLNKEKFEVSVCYLEKDNMFSSILEANKIKLYFLDVNKKTNILKAILKLRDVLKKNKFHILHTHLAYSGIVGRLTGKFVGIPVIISTQHNLPNFNNKLLNLLERATLKLADIIICVSPGIEKYFFNNINIFTGKEIKKGINHFTIFNGVDVNEINKNINKENYEFLKKKFNIKDEIILGCISRLVEIKGIHEIILIFGYLVNYCKLNLKLILIGEFEDFKYKKKILNAIKYMKLSERVILIEGTENPFIFFSIIDIFILLYKHKFTLSENGIGLSIMEALVAGKLVITTNNSGIVRFLDKNIINNLVRIIDVENIKQSIDIIVKTIEDINNIKRKSYILKKELEYNFSIKKTASLYEKVYLEIFEKKFNLKD